MDVFLSYAREDRDRAGVLAAALDAHGWSVWWDRRLIAGQAFDQAIEQELEQAKAVVVLWSEHSVTSEWVKNEAAVAAERGVLVPVLLDHVRQPLEFRRRQAADLSSWTGDPSDAELAALVEGIRRIANVSPGQPRSAVRTRKRLVRPLLWPWTAIGVVAVLATLAWYNRWPPLPRAEPGPTTLGAPVPVVDVPSGPAEGQTPFRLDVGAIAKVRLQKGEQRYFVATQALAAVRVVLDTRRVDQRVGNLLSRVSIVDSDGAVVEDRVIRVNEIDVSGRKTALWSAPQSRSVGLRLVNDADTADFWLAMQLQSSSELIPFYGTVAPQPIAVGESKSGDLNGYHDVHYAASLAEGEYRVMIDFDTRQRQMTNILGRVDILDADGGKNRTLIQLNAIDVSYRKADLLSVQKGERVILRVVNHSNGSVRYGLTLASAQ